MDTDKNGYLEELKERVLGAIFGEFASSATAAPMAMQSKTPSA
jgi:hypothetical protein